MPRVGALNHQALQILNVFGLSLERSLVIQSSLYQGKSLCWALAHGHGLGTIYDTGQSIQDMVPSINHRFHYTSESTWIWNKKYHPRVTIFSFIVNLKKILKRIMAVDLYPLKIYLS